MAAASQACQPPTKQWSAEVRPSCWTIVFCGGNSTKATSGINSAGTKTQKAKGSQTMPSFHSGHPEGWRQEARTAKVPCVNRLVDKSALALSLVAHLGEERSRVTTTLF